MAQYTNSTPNSNDWNLYFQPFPYSEGLVVLLILLYGLKIQLQKPNRRRNVKLIQEFQRRVVHLLNTLMNWCAHMQGFDDTHIEKHVINVKVVPYENRTIVKPEKKKEDKHPWDIAQEIILEQKQAALAVKWAVLPLETLMDEQFLTILHAIEGITDATPLKEAAKQLPKKIYEIIKSQEQLTRIPAELTDQLVFDVSKTYYYSVIESLCRLIKSIQQGQRTALVSLAKIVQDQRDEIEKYQTLLKLPEEVRHLQLRLEKLKKHVNTHLERIDKKTSVTSVTVSEIRSQIHRLETTMEGNFEHIPEPDKPSWVFPGNIVELHAPEDDILFHEECVSQIPSNGHQQQEESSTTGGELQEEQDNIPHGLSPPRQYIPAGAEGGESNSSSSTCEEEETVEEGLAHYFSNPSYRAANPALLEPIDPEEDWGDTPPVLLPLQISQGPSQPTTRFEKRQRYVQKRRERRRQNEWGRNHDQDHLNH